MRCPFLIHLAAMGALLLAATPGPCATPTTQETTDEKVDWDEYFKDGFRGAAFAQENQDDEDQLERPPVFIPTGQQDLEEQLRFTLDDELERLNQARESLADEIERASAEQLLARGRRALG